MNCHGCMYLDEFKKNGDGYCCKVCESKTQNEKARYSNMERCELYKHGEFKNRFKIK